MKKISLLTIPMIAFSSLAAFSCATKQCDHNYVLVSDSATCEHDGERKYQCSLCGNEKTEPSQKLFHCFNSSGICEKCSATLNIIPAELPAQLSYYGYFYGTYMRLSGFDITELKYTKFTHEIRVFFSGNKTFDVGGTTGDLGLIHFKLNKANLDSSGTQVSSCSNECSVNHCKYGESFYDFSDFDLSHEPTNNLKFSVSSSWEPKTN